MNKKIAAPGQMLVLAMISEFCLIGLASGDADCKESKEGSAIYRVLTLKDNGGTIKESSTFRRHELYLRDSESPLPVENYSAKFWVEPDERDPNRTVIHWTRRRRWGKSDDEASRSPRRSLAGLKSISRGHAEDAGAVGREP